MANTLRFKRGLLAGLPSAAVGEPLFTTDTFDLYIGTASGTQKYQKFIASGTTSQLLRGDGSLLTMPIVLSSPANGEVLKYNGTNWVNSSDAGITGSGVAGQVAYFTGATTQGGSNNLFWDATNSRLGIGTNTPLLNLQINSVTGSNSTLAFSENGVLKYYNRYIASTGAYQIVDIPSVTTRLQITSNGNVQINSLTDNGLRFQVTGDGYFSGSVGIGTTAITDVNLYIRKNLSGSVFPSGLYIDSTVQSTSTTGAAYISTSVSTQASTFTLPNLYHFRATQSTIGAGSTVTNQYGYIAEASLIGATNNYGFYGNIAAATGRWNLYMNGTAANYLAGTLSIGTTANDTGYLRNYATIPVLALQNPTTGTAVSDGFQLSVSGSLAYIWQYENSAMLFGTNATERMRLDASGNLGLGVTPSAGSLWRQFEIGAAGASLTGRPSNTEIFLTQNAYHNNSSWIYKVNGTAAYFGIDGGDFRWYNAPSGTAAGAITFTERMRLFNATGNLTIGSTPTDAGFKLDVNGTMRVSGASTLSGGATIPTGFFLNFGSSGIADSSGALLIRTQANPMTFSGHDGGARNFYFNGYIGINTNTPAYRLDVNGDARVVGAATFSSSVTVGGNFTVDTETLFVDAANNFVGVGTTTPAHRLHVVSSGTKSTIAIGNNLSGTYSQLLMYGGLNKYNWSIGAQYNVNNAFEITPSTAIDGTTFSTPALTIASTGAATFSSSVTAASLTATSNNASVINARSGNASGYAYYSVGRTSEEGVFGVAGAANQFFTGAVAGDVFIGANNNKLHFGTNASTAPPYMTISSGNVGIGMTPSYKLDVTGSARISDAIAIGTTPDTNLPFKILKNINSTVGIRFENTSTGASSFTGYQFGTDVSGGTAFTNFLYASSGVTETGVYKPNGTALINTGSGGLNFLAVSQPIRFFTSTGNGTLRAAITNDGDFTQYNGTNPSASTTDAFRMYSADITAGNAAPHFRTENGGIIKLYQQTTGVTSATYIGGAGTGLTDSDTFDGYTIAQIVKALRNAGLLA